jgi:hypothetical protein
MIGLLDEKLTLVNAKFGAKLEILKYLKKAELTPFDLPKILQFSLSLNGFNQAEFATIFYKIRDCVATTDIEKTNPLVCLKSNIDNIEKIFVTNFCWMIIYYC